MRYSNFNRAESSKGGSRLANGRRRRGAGFTLIELVITVVILGVLAGVMSPMLAASIDGYLLARRIKLTDTQASVSMSRIAKEIKDANDLYGLGSTVVDDFQFFAPNVGYTIRYYLDTGTGQLLRTQDGGPPQPLADGVTAFQVFTDNGKLVTIELTFGDVNYTLRTKVLARNVP